MGECDKRVEIGRRRFLRGGAILAAAGVASNTAANATPALARVEYPSNRLTNITELRLNVPLRVAYPDPDAHGILLKLGKRVPGGVGPDGDIVGFSAVCPHKGVPLSYDPTDKSLNCPGHYSRFDCEAGGQQIWGHATQNLPQYVLRVDGNGDIYSDGIDELLYGRLSNVL